MHQKNLEIERLRGVAVLLVILTHLNLLSPFVGLTWRQGWTGVDLFFVISGFVVTRSLAGLLPDISNQSDFLERLRAGKKALIIFFARRFFRIVPMAVLWAALPLLALRYFNDSGAFGQAKMFELGKVFVSIVTLQYNYSLISSAIPEVLPWYWSLAVEEHFYLLLPLFLMFFATDSRRLRAGVIAILAINFLVRPLSPVPSYVQEDRIMHWYMMSSHLRFDTLLLGVCLALMWNNGFFKPASITIRTRQVANAVSLLLIFGVWAMPTFVSHPVIFTTGLFVVGLYSTVLVHMASHEKNLVLGLPGISKALEYIGSRSYGLYLIHCPSESLLKEMLTRFGLTDSLSPLAQLLLWAILTVTLTELSFRLVETPLIRLGRHLTSGLAAGEHRRNSKAAA